MITGFDSAFDALIDKNEAGYSNDPEDPGGETMWGITKRVARAHGYMGPMPDLPREGVLSAKSIAKTAYWDPYSCDQMPPDVAFHVFDTAYNGGHPAVWLQQAIGSITVDGDIGPRTIGALRASNLETVKRKFGAYRQIYLANLPGFNHDGRGWMRRLASNQLIT